MGDGETALHLHFSEPLEAGQRELILKELKANALLRLGPALTPAFDGAVVLLSTPHGIRPDYYRLRDAAQHFGFQSVDGDLPFMSHSRCSTVDHPAHVADTPLLKQ